MISEYSAGIGQGAPPETEAYVEEGIKYYAQELTSAVLQADWRE